MSSLWQRWLERIANPLWRAWGRLAFPLMRLLRWLALQPLVRKLTNSLHLPGWFPLTGDIVGRYLCPPVRVRFEGRGTMSAPTLEIIIDGARGTAVPEALSAVAQRLFVHRPRFAFNVCFSCGRGGRHGVYADPRSIWFNVFFGYYEIDVSRDEWRRPFGYQTDPDGELQLDLHEIALMGEADWNHFSNYLYGVSLRRVKRFDDVTVKGRVLGRRPIGDGSRAWDEATLTDLEVVSSYQAAQGERLETTPHPFLRGIFRAAFGGPRSRPEFKASFFPTLMDAHFWTCWDAPPGDDRDLGVPVYRTFIFGATIDLTYPERRVITARHVAQQRRGALFLGGRGPGPQRSDCAEPVVHAGPVRGGRTSHRQRVCRARIPDRRRASGSEVLSVLIEPRANGALRTEVRSSASPSPSCGTSPRGLSQERSMSGWRALPQRASTTSEAKLRAGMSTPYTAPRARTLIRTSSIFWL